ncbi:MBL fold metallo-hydrolase [Pseudothermotoga thermarum]|uniref:Zn-dependent hydrolase of the beta-lactamase fold-like protein n=1 Tax=Pseudothermotoga thermarum DSM 5069 TaxID=688269 RepID=F7YTE2_9THEM|nr:MBL fold metallo-hydrolase [Pseudothermotoga thermarum]AEH50120.1 hypothetical protein Theth_0012 [Pseudothermotoga thermarum DSM 5069]
MKLVWFGHACFLIDTGNVKILTDPFDSSVGYKVPTIAVDLITESHQHFDHNAHHLIKGNFQLIKEPGVYEFKDVKIKGIRTFHDAEKGSKRGQNIIFVFEINGIRIGHFGDLGHVPTQEQIREIGQLDIALIPVGGTFTIGPKEAKQTMDLLNPHVVVPMHYKTKYLKFDIAGVEDFTKLCENVKYLESNELTIDESIKSEQKAVFVLKL